MGAAGGVDVMVAAVEAVGHGVDPAFQLHLDFARPLLRNGDLLLLHVIFRAAAVDHGQLAWRQKHGAAVVAIDLVLEEEVGSEPFAWADRRGLLVEE